MNYFVTGIDTDSGKTLVCAILCEALGYSYWKPVQAGLPRDADAVKALSPQTFIFPSAYFLNTPASPHAAAKIDGIAIEPEMISCPTATTGLIIEGAGGCLVPLNDNYFVIDLATKFETEVILVADLYLGSINHTLLTINELKRRNLNIKGIIFNGEANPESERTILHHSNIKCLLHIAKEAAITEDIVKKYAKKLASKWYE